MPLRAVGRLAQRAALAHAEGSALCLVRRLDDVDRIGHIAQDREDPDAVASVGVALRRVRDDPPVGGALASPRLAGSSTTSASAGDSPMSLAASESTVRL
jgi:hypothetical protein